MLKVAVTGASGYMGAELLRLLSVHPQVRISAVTSERLAGERLVVWKGGHDFSHFERDAPRVMKFYADALADC